VSFDYRIHLSRDGPLDRTAAGVDAGQVVSGTVILPTAGPLWIDARLTGEPPRSA
jgi:hypothetical protein